MAEVENGTDETNFFDSARWKTCLKIKTFLLSLWMMCDVALDVKSCIGYYQQSMLYETYLIIFRLRKWVSKIYKATFFGKNLLSMHILVTNIKVLDILVSNVITRQQQKVVLKHML